MNLLARATLAGVLGIAVSIPAALATTPVPTPATPAGPCSQQSIERTVDTITVRGAVRCTLTDLARFVPDTQLKLVDPAKKTWLLQSFVFLEDGATLALHGTPAGGDVDVLHLQSDGSDGGTIAISAQWGVVDIRATRIAGWDSSANEPHVTAGDGTTPRAYIRALSFLDGDVARESTMNIVDSEISYLGYHAAASYSLSWKVEGTGIPGSDSPVFDRVKVYGTVTGSNIHDCYMAAYMFGGYGMLWENNDFHHNLTYGWDGHDNTRNSIVRNNRAYNNGWHGIICSQNCSELQIVGNDARDNGRHGIMIHKNVFNSLVEGNTSDHNGETGVAVFASHDNILRNNVATRNRRGIHVYVGSSGNLIEHNLVSNNTEDGIYFSPGEGGVPNDNTVNFNVLDGNLSSGLEDGNADRQSFQGNMVNGVCADTPASACSGAGPLTPIRDGGVAGDGGPLKDGGGWVWHPQPETAAVPPPPPGEGIPLNRKQPETR